jgi:hypothetical protein
MKSNETQKNDFTKGLSKERFKKGQEYLVEGELRRRTERGQEWVDLSSLVRPGPALSILLKR